ncbi:SUKH-4 family immunity protein [Streptomyces kunmingensis]|uniref:SUKH-4 family immunity protein n=1 Tax=Streptomyces kunmingensis TaxID=68225 RepID=A0ABU6C5T8_9ACTN|nr:SUKH-4 family immunity protein [Streptomyces kunmingensis]MEB3959180.1 SUKH-4 family immunity protein [Streptomyces kunmingensis]
MKHTVTNADLVRVHGLDGVVYFPQTPRSPFSAETANFLSSVGLPHNRLFETRADVGIDEDQVDPIELGPLFDLDDLACPEERRHWQMFGYLRTTLVVVAPETGTVHGYPEGEEDSVPLHRDVESLAFCLTELRRLQDAYSQGGDTDVLATRFRDAVNAFDDLPLGEEESEWTIMLEEFTDGMW